MSAIASFTKMPTSSLEGLRKAAIPKKRLFGKPRDVYFEYLQQHGREVVYYKWPGFLLATLLIYLDEKHKVKLMESEYGDLATFLTQSRGVTHFVFTNAQRETYLNTLGGQFSQEELCTYYNEFNATEGSDAGPPLRDGVIAIHQALSQLDENSVIIFSLG